MAGRPKHYKDEELIDRALKVFWSKGYNAASAQDLMQAMNIGQGSFYRTFPGGKKELYQKSLKRQAEKTIYRFNNELEESKDQIQFIRDFFMTIGSRSKSQVNDGCFFGNTIVELSNLEEETKLISVNLLTKMRDNIEKAISKAQSQGKLKTKQSSKAIALHLINLWNGINITQRAYPDEEQINEMIEINLQVLT